MPSTIANSVEENSENVMNMLTAHSGLLQSAIQENDKRLVTRVLHHFPQVRSKLSSPILLPILRQSNGFLLTKAAESLNSPPSPSNATIVNTLNNSASETYFALLTAVHLLDSSKLMEAEQLLVGTISFVEQANGRLFDPLLARCYYFLGRSLELQGSLTSAHNYLMVAFRSSALRHDMESHATIYNLLLRLLLLHGNQFEVAHKLVSKSPFPASNSPSSSVTGANQARYHYYLAVIEATQADYASAKENLLQALRKAPHGKTAIGFVQAVNKLMVVTQLLLGEIPERALFRQPILVNALRPYFALTQSVQLGDLARFQGALEKLQASFIADRTLTLVQRLHQNVLKAGLKRLNKAYSRLPLLDVQRKLCLASVEDAAFVLMKAIKDEVIEGQVDLDGGFLTSTAISTPYYTCQPQEQLHQRITELDALHNDCLRSMRYTAAEVKKTGKDSNSNAPATEAEMIEEYLDAEDFM